MSDQELHIDHPELMSRYLSGNATAAEVQQLEAWVSSDPEHRRQFMAFKKAWILSGMVDDRQTVDVDDQWQKTAAQLFPEARTVPLKSRSYRWLGMAAGIALLVSLAIWALLYLGAEREMFVAAADQVRTIELPDGSTVTLNRFSSLRYTPVPSDEESFTIAQRLIDLEGDAYFEVVRDTERPFLVVSGDVEVVVLGTSFYVDARELQPEVQVIVESGQVAVRTDTIVNLSAGEQAVYDKSRESLISKANEDPNFLSIRTGTLQFEDTPLAGVVFAIQRHYGVTLVTGGVESTAGCNLKGEYPGLSLDELLLLLQEAWGLEVNRNGDRVELTGTGCRTE